MDLANNKALQRKSLGKKELIKSWLIWTMFAQTTYNFERLQALGFCHSMIPILTRLYEKKEDLASGLKRHLAFFNTESNWGSMIPGIVAAMEEERANGAEINDDMINSTKTALMGPLAGIGDSITQGLVKVILLSLGVDLAVKGNVLGPILFFTIFSVYTLGLSYIMYMSGYRIGKNAVIKLLETNILERATNGLGAIGMMVVGALASTMIKINVPLVFKIGGSSIKVQDIFNQIMPNLLPLALLFLAFYWLKKGKSPLWTLCMMFIIGFVCSYLKILA
ncbi:MAG TPA: PTS system mannose/fructose/sorbose family transporter subunit IID [Thermoanaerobacterales bacterium]|nr:PTS system mannose/fructose/sorbose family transporter subunit IID [Thermoanaerobacterales bacterium]